MGLFDKVKNFFYDEEYEEEIEAPIKEEKKHKKEKIKIIEKKEKPKIKREKEEEISERELFKAERTFNFPMDIEEDEYTSIKLKKEEKPIIVEEKKVIPKPKEEKAPAYTGIRTFAKKEEEVKEEDKKFSPSPVISPIYGILDKNYKKEDLIIDSVKEDKQPTTKVDYDSVRKKAYADVYEEKEEENIFYNLDSKEDDKEENSDVKIIYNDVSLDEEEDKNATIGQKIEEYERKQKEEEEEEDFEVDDDSQILSETKEQDLFNLIDNMYNSDEEDEEEE